MILTFKVKHGSDLTSELQKAIRVAKFAVKTKARSSKDVAHFGLKSAISNQILKKYSKNRRCKFVRSVKLTVPSQSVNANHETTTLTVPCLKLTLPYQFRNDFSKVNQIELDNTYAYVSVSIPEQQPIEPKGYVGVDRNATSHIAVCSLPSGKILKLGKPAQHIRNKYKAIRKQMQRQAKFKKLATIKRRESNIVRDINHKISNKIVQTAKANNLGIKLEKLEGIRQRAKTSKSFKGTLHSWSFYQLEMFLEYKAKLLGIPVVYVDPRYTSQRCSRCGQIGTRNGKKFVCHACGYVEHADVNASFNIANSPPLTAKHIQLQVERDVCKGNTDIPQKATERKISTLEPHVL